MIAQGGVLSISRTFSPFPARSAVRALTRAGRGEETQNDRPAGFRGHGAVGGADHAGDPDNRPFPVADDRTPPSLPSRHLPVYEDLLHLLLRFQTERTDPVSGAEGADGQRHADARCVETLLSAGCRGAPRLRGCDLSRFFQLQDGFSRACNGGRLARPSALPGSNEGGPPVPVHQFPTLPDLNPGGRTALANRSIDGP